MRFHPAPDPRDTVVDTRELRFSYGDFRAVDDVSIQVVRGEIHALLGSNGAGKTTTLELLQGHRRRSGGDLSVFGVEPARSPHVLRERTGVMLQEAGLFEEVSPRVTLTLWQRLSSRVDEVDRALEAVELTHRADAPVATLSGGERRRLDLALATWGRPELLVLDEPTTGLDPASRRTLWRTVRDLNDGGATIVLTTHYLEEVEALADRVTIMDAGRVALAGTLDEVLQARPARITADVTGVAARRLPTSAPAGADLTWSTVSRPHGERRALSLSSDDHQGTLLWLLRCAADADVRLERLRASPASLEEVFLEIRGEGSRSREAAT